MSTAGNRTFAIIKPDAVRAGKETPGEQLSKPCRRQPGDSHEGRQLGRLRGVGQAVLEFQVEVEQALTVMLTDQQARDRRRRGPTEVDLSPVDRAQDGRSHPRQPKTDEPSTQGRDRARHRPGGRGDRGEKGRDLAPG